jgi:hypothetical protein
MAKVKIINKIIINLGYYSNSENDDEQLAHALPVPKVNSALHHVARLEPAKKQTSTHTHHTVA